MTKSVERGVYLPVLEVEKLSFYRDGRGLEVNDDGDVCASHVWVPEECWVSSNQGGAMGLPAASSLAWLKITYSSGGSDTVGYIPIFSGSVR